MTSDLTAAIVAAIGIVGTLTAPLIAQRSASHARRLEFELQRQERLEERAHADRRAAYEEKRDAYADLNAAVRGFASAAETSLRDLMAEHPLPDQPLTPVEEALRPYRGHYARAQMLLGERPMLIASEVNRGVNSAYSALVQLQQTYDVRAAEELRSWFSGGMSEGVWVLRKILREDLGVGEPFGDFHAALRLLQDTRKSTVDRGKPQRGLGIGAVGGYTSGIEPGPNGQA
ncbi:hypothetical protein ABZ876_27960 [Streptomyces sp. NPDC046931]|uniref:hypothetical protein n=1 Tax=Streptomyces sp. NPDC046931 TaxID=3154806 RepID=UPI0033CF0566